MSAAEAEAARIKSEEEEEEQENEAMGRSIQKSGYSYNLDKRRADGLEQFSSTTCIKNKKTELLCSVYDYFSSFVESRSRHRRLEIFCNLFPPPPSSASSSSLDPPPDRHGGCREFGQ